MSVKPDRNVGESRAGRFTGTLWRLTKQELEGTKYESLHLGAQGAKGWFFALGKTLGNEQVYQLVEYSLDESGSVRFKTAYEEFQRLCVHREE
eukprot:11193622-Lingulodinium_polyedra.AAC.1